MGGFPPRGISGGPGPVLDPLLLRLAYDAGLGERNSQGFGMFRGVRGVCEGLLRAH
ncbi:MAG: CRISPR-associated endoribonuclease Cas6 [bacterium]